MADPSPLFALHGPVAHRLAIFAPGIVPARTRPRLPNLLASAALLGMVTTMSASGCVTDADCGICDPDNLLLESISGVNYASKKIHLLNPTCEGPDCPKPFDEGTYFIETIGPCESTQDALDSPNAEEFCRLSPLVTDSGVEFVFNNLLEPTSIELVRKRPDNPQLFEVYDWKERVVQIEGPITRFNGDYDSGGTDRPDLVSRLVNLSCIDNLRDQGIPFTNESYEDPQNNPCNRIDGEGNPLKMRQDGTMKSYGGIWTTFGSDNNCSSPQEGPDTCCTRCDWLLSTQVARYGVTADGLPRSPNGTPIQSGAQPTAPAITCDAGVETPSDPMIACREFVTSVNRSEEEQSWEYYWECDPESGPDCQPGTYALPYYDKLRETHPDDRPPWLEKRVAQCTTTSQCTSAEGHDLPGTQCIGELANGDACLIGTYTGDAAGECTAGFCRPEWFVECRANPETTGGEQGYCADVRFAPTGTAGCFDATESFAALCEDSGDGEKDCAPSPARAGTNLAVCDGNENGRLTAFECCQDSLSGTSEDPKTCDPFYQQNLRAQPRYTRDENLPQPTRDCVCALPAEPGCERPVEIGCLDSEGNMRPEREGQYAVKFIARRGGVVYDPAIKGFEFQPADIGSVPRADIESCAEGLIGGRNRHEGWRANDAGAEAFEDFDRAMCSGQTYTVVFQEPGQGVQFIEDKVGNTLEGKSRYTFETSQFHVVPGTGFPSDNLRIGACDDFALSFSNKFDLSPENVQKIRLVRIDEQGQQITPNDDCSNADLPVAGGPGCARTVEDRLDASGTLDPCRQPCLTTDVGDQFAGTLRVEIDAAVFGPILETGERYRMVVPTAATVEQAIGNADVYDQVFWDVCGMPLVSENATAYQYEFTIDRPKCKEDQDGDSVQLSCDNAPLFFNPDQGDIDGDGVGDVVDLCPTVPGPPSNSADSDKDGVGNDCDSCRQTTMQYNANAASAGITPYMQVRNVPFQNDADNDGIGDVCDNCILTANCEDYNEGNPWQVGDPIAYDDDNACQRDDNSNMIGDACEGTMPKTFAAGPIGLGDADDFDQDGIANADDLCPRQPLEETLTGDPPTCTGDQDCEGYVDPGDGSAPTVLRRCTAGVCNHADTDLDGVGNVCDTCPFVTNTMQVTDGGMQEDDDDGDFVGSVCETQNACATRKDPRPFSFFNVQSLGNCCTVRLATLGELRSAMVLAESDEIALRELEEELGRTFEDADLMSVESLNPLLDPGVGDDPRVPIRVTCSVEEQDANICRALPPKVTQTPGILTPAPGCEEAFASTEGQFSNAIRVTRDGRLSEFDFDGDLDALWQNMCFLPQFDQDFDGLGEPCDLCPFDFDPENLQYIDVNSRVWPMYGKFCRGAYDIQNRCEDEDDPDGETDGDTDTDGTGGETGGSSGSGGTGA